MKAKHKYNKIIALSVAVMCIVLLSLFYIKYFKNIDNSKIEKANESTNSQIINSQVSNEDVAKINKGVRDINSFVMGTISEIAHDNYHVYLPDEYRANRYPGDSTNTQWWNPVIGANKETFKYMGVCASVEKSSASYYKDSNYVYVEGNTQIGIDAATFEFLGNYTNTDGMGYSSAYARDKYNVYFGCGVNRDQSGNPIDKKTFVVLGNGYAKDKNRIWFLGYEMKGVDSETFKVVNDHKDLAVAKDKNNLYLDGGVVEESELIKIESQWKETEDNNKRTSGIDNAARQIAIEYNIYGDSPFCLSSFPDYINPRNEIQIISFREVIGKSERGEDCKGKDGQGELFRIKIDTKDGSAYAKMANDNDYKMIQLNANENEATTMTLDQLKAKMTDVIKILANEEAKKIKDQTTFTKFEDYYWVYLRRNPIDRDMEFLPKDIDQLSILSPCFGAPYGQCME